MASCFISYRSADKSDALRLAGDLKKMGHEVWIDELELGIGDSIIEKIDSGLSAVQYVVVCYSESGVDSKWMSREWMSALAGMLNGRSIKLLPVKFGNASPPSILSDIKFADFGSDWDNGLALLGKALK